MGIDCNGDYFEQDTLEKFEADKEELNDSMK